MKNTIINGIEYISKNGEVWENDFMVTKDYKGISDLIPEIEKVESDIYETTEKHFVISYYFESEEEADKHINKYIIDERFTKIQL